MAGVEAPRMKWDGEESQVKREFMDGVMVISHKTGLSRVEEQWNATFHQQPVRGTGKSILHKK